MNMRSYSIDSMERALQHHVKEGRLRAYNREDERGAKARWAVTGNYGIRQMDESLSDRECAALLFGLASAQYANKEVEA